MSISILELMRCTQRHGAARAALVFPGTQSAPGTQAAIDHAITRADLATLVARRKHELVAIRLQRDNDVTDAQLKLGLAQAALDEFDAHPVPS